MQTLNEKQAPTPYPPHPPSSQKKGAQELKDDILSSLRRISEDPDMREEFITFMGRFHDYSLYNRILIFLQYPEASQIAGYQTWRKLGRYVRAGERGIRIFAPLVKKIEAKNEDDEPAERRIIRGYKVVSVFDYAQTDSKDGTDLEVPSIGRLIVHDPEAVYARIKNMAEREGLKVVESAMNFTVGGSTDGNIIWLNKLTPLDGRCTTILHELAHVKMLHLTDRRDIPRKQKEIEAELASFLTGVSIGLPRGNYDYIRGWQQEEDISDEVIERAIRTADELSAKISGYHT